MRNDARGKFTRQIDSGRIFDIKVQKFTKIDFLTVIVDNHHSHHSLVTLDPFNGLLQIVCLEKKTLILILFVLFLAGKLHDVFGHDE